MKTYFRSFIRDNTIVLIGQVLMSLRGIILMPLIIKSVGTKVYGGYVLLSLAFNILFGISSLGVGLRARRFLPSTTEPAQRRVLFYPQFLFQMLALLILSALWLIFQDPINTYLLKNEVAYVSAIVPVFLISYLLYSQGSDYFRYTGRVLPMMTAGVCYLYFQVIIIVLLSYFKVLDVDLLVVADAVAMVTIAIPCFAVLAREIGLVPAALNVQEIKQDIKVGFPVVLGLIQEFILSVFDRFFIALFLSVAAVGAYASAYTIGAMIMFIPKALGTALPQLLSKAVDSNDEQEAQQMLNYAMKLFLLLAIPFTFGVTVLGKPILQLLANQEVAESASAVVPIISCAAIFYGLNAIMTNILFVRLKTVAILKMNMIASVFNLVSNLALLFFFRSILACAVTAVLSYAIAFLYILSSVRSTWRIDFHVPALAKSVVASLCMAVVVYGMSFLADHPSAPTTLALEIAAGIICYAVALIGMKTFSEKEIRYVRGMVGR